MILYKEIRTLSDSYEHRLKKQIDARVLEMDGDDRLHHMLYQVLGVTAKRAMILTYTKIKAVFYTNMRELS